ncbi:MAG: pteridine reductase [Chromatiaceae bacterium]|nr:pteridine reductase [Chromatiaceae bacterium]
MTAIDDPLSGKVALVTGAARRIGAEIVRLLHREGMDILLHYRSARESAKQLAIELTARRQDSVRLIEADLLNRQALDNLVHQAKAWRGRLDLLVNNASSFYATPLASAGEAEWEELMGTNLKAPFFLAKAAAPLLRASQGCIVNLVDIHAERPLADHPIYNIAKAGNAMMVKTLAWELGPEVRVNGVAPGAILWPNQEMPEKAKAEIISRTALKRAGTPADIARTVLFLAQGNNYISGQIIAVDGGRSVQQ